MADGMISGCSVETSSSFQRLSVDCLLLVARCLKEHGGDPSTLRRVCTKFRDAIDAGRSCLRISPAMMQQHLALARFARPPTCSSSPPSPCSAGSSPQHADKGVLAALRRWSDAEHVVAIGHLPLPWIPQLVSLALAEGQMALLQDFFLHKLRWSHPDPHVKTTTAQMARIRFLRECIMHRAMPTSEALPRLQVEVEALTGSLSAWTQAWTWEDGPVDQRMPKGRMDSMQWLLLMLCTCLIYRGDYASALAVMSMRLCPEGRLAGVSDAVRGAWCRETLVLVQLARQQHEGAVEALLGAPCWAQVAAVGRRLSASLLLAGCPSLQRRADEYLAAGQAQQPAAMEQWHATLDLLGSSSYMPACLFAAIDAGVDSIFPGPITGGSGRALAARRLLSQRTAEYLQLLAVGHVDAAVAALLEPFFEPVPLDMADGLVALHLLPCLGLHQDSVPTPSQQAQVQRLVEGVWQAVGQDPRRVSRSCKAQVLLSNVAWLQLNRGSLHAALEVSKVPEPLQARPGRLRAWLSMLTCMGAGATPAAKEADVQCTDNVGDSHAAIGVWQWSRSAWPKLRVPKLPEAIGLLEHACNLLGSNVNLTHNACGGPTDSWCCQELALLAAVPAPGGRPAYSLQPHGAALLRELVGVPSYRALRHACKRKRFSIVKLTSTSPAVFEGMCMLNDLESAAVAFATSTQPERATALDVLCLALLKRLYGSRFDATSYGVDSSLTRAALLAIYGHPQDAAQVLQHMPQWFGAEVLGLPLAAPVVECIKEVLRLSAVTSSSGDSTSITGPASASSSHSDTAESAGDLIMDAAHGEDDNNWWPTGLALASSSRDSQQAAAAALAAGNLLLALPNGWGNKWKRPDDEANACRMVLSLVLLQPQPQPQGGPPHLQGPDPTRLLRRLHWADPSRLQSDNWHVAHHRAVQHMLLSWAREAREVREGALQRLMQLLQAVLLPDNGEKLAALLGGVLVGAPAWAYAPPLAGAWLGWARDCCGEQGVRCWEAFTSAFRCRRVMEFDADDDVQGELPDRMEALMRVVVQNAPAAVWLAPVLVSAASLQGASACGMPLPSAHLSWLLRALVGSWAVQPFGVAAVAGREWCLGLVREARLSGGRGNATSSSSGLASIMATVIAAVASELGMHRLADAVLWESAQGAHAGAAL